MAKATLGRPTKYNKETADKIVQRMAEGESLNSICQDDDIPSKGTVLGWVFDDREDFSDQYEKAMQIRAHGWAEEIVEISDTGCTQPILDDNGKVVIVDGKPLTSVSVTGVSHARLQTDNRKWIVSKLLPKFSDKPASIFGDDSEEIESVTVKRVDGSSDKRKQTTI